MFEGDEAFTKQVSDVLVQHTLLAEKKGKYGLNRSNPQISEIITYAKMSRRKHELPQMFVAFFSSPTGPVAKIAADLPERTLPDIEEAWPETKLSVLDKFRRKVAQRKRARAEANALPPLEEPETGEREEELPEEPEVVEPEELPQEEHHAELSESLRRGLLQGEVIDEPNEEVLPDEKEEKLQEEMHKILGLPTPRPISEREATRSQLARLQREFMVYKVGDFTRENRRKREILLIKRFADMKLLTLQGVTYRSGREIGPVLRRMNSLEIRSILRQIMAHVDDELSTSFGSQTKRIVRRFLKR